MSDIPADDCTVCFCNCVKRSELVAAIRAGATTHELIMERTKASTGCGGCEPEVLEVLEAELAAARQAQKAG